MKERNESHFWIFVLIGIFLIITTTGFARMAYGIILPFMQEGLHLSTAQSGMLGTILFRLFINCRNIWNIYYPFWRKISFINRQLVRRYKLNGISVCFFILDSCFCMLCAGAGSALVYTPLMSITVGWFPDKRGTVMGLLLSGAGIGMLFSGIIVPYVVRTFPEYSWRGAWFCLELLHVSLYLPLQLF